MTKEKTFQMYLTSLGWKAYEESTVPEDATLPRFTYSFVDAEFGDPVSMAISAWDSSYSWATVTEMKDALYESIGLGGKVIPYDDGYIWVKRGQPFSQRMPDEDDKIRRIYINIEVEYLTHK